MMCDIGLCSIKGVKNIIIGGYLSLGAFASKDDSDPIPSGT